MSLGQQINNIGNEEGMKSIIYIKSNQRRMKQIKHSMIYTYIYLYRIHTYNSANHSVKYIYIKSLSSRACIC